MKKLSKQLPHLPGVYLFKNKDGDVIYIGKAKILKNRVASYFQDSHHDWKIASLMDEYDDLDFIVTNTETEAMLLEAQLIQRYQPKFNVLFKDGQPFLYILFTQDDLPTIKIVRNKKQKGTYFGPFLHKTQARRVFNYLMRTFRLTLCKSKIAQGCLKYHLGLCPGSCRPDFDAQEYLFRIELAKSALKHNYDEFLEHLRNQIAQYNKEHAFEKSKRLAHYLENFQTIFNTLKVHFSEHKYADKVFAAVTPAPVSPAADPALADKIQELLKLDHPIHAIDCFDISHFQSQSIVGSCVRFTHGVPEKNKFRRFAIKSLVTQDDYAALQEIVQRRYRDKQDIPDLVLIDGGKGQLSAVKAVLPNAICASIAKREETLFSEQFPQGLLLDKHNEAARVLLALRDYAHHFAISYHKLKRSKKDRVS